MPKAKKSKKEWKPNIHAAFEKDLEKIAALIAVHHSKDEIAEKAGVDGSALSRLYPKPGKSRSIPGFDIMYKVLYTLVGCSPLNLEPAKGAKALKVLSAIRNILEELED